jgi:chromosome segregation ATPase
MDKAHQESLVIKFDVDLDPKTNVEYRKGSKKSFYLEKLELQDDYEGSQQECKELRVENDSYRQGVAENEKKHTYQLNTLRADFQNKLQTEKDRIKPLEEVIKGLKSTRHDLEAELVKVRSECDKLKADNNENESLLKIADQEIKVLKSVRKIPLLGTDTLSYQSDILLRWQDHMEHWNELVSDFQDKYCPALAALTKTVLEFIDSFVRRVKNVEI